MGWFFCRFFWYQNFKITFFVIDFPTFSVITIIVKLTYIMRKLFLEACMIWWEIFTWSYESICRILLFLLFYKNLHGCWWEKIRKRNLVYSKNPFYDVMVIFLLICFLPEAKTASIFALLSSFKSLPQFTRSISNSSIPLLFNNLNSKISLIFLVSKSPVKTLKTNISSN